MLRALAPLAFIASISSVNLHAQSGTQTLADLHNRARPLLIFAPSVNDPRAQKQMQFITPHAAEANDRAMPIIVIAQDAPITVFSKPEQENMRRRFHILPSQFVVVLIGKDGGEKLRSTQPISYEKLAATIDAMPMRQDEMKERK